jgi:hypothetical protein
MKLIKLEEFSEQILASSLLLSYCSTKWMGKKFHTSHIEALALDKGWKFNFKKNLNFKF